MYPSQTGILNLQITANHYRQNNPEAAKFFDSFVKSFLNHPKFQNQVQFMLDNGLIDKEGKITSRGEALSGVSPQFMQGKALGIKTNLFIFEALKKDVLGECFKHMDEDTFVDIAMIIDKEMQRRYPEQLQAIELEERLKEQAMVEDHILMVQAPVEIIRENEVIETTDVVELEPKKKRTKKPV